MKKHLSLILRIVVAAAGLGYIGYTLNWTDKVEFPAGATAPDGQKLEKPKAFAVVTRDFDPAAIKVPLVVTADPKNAAAPTRAIQPSDLGAGEGKYLLRPGLKTTLRHARIGLLVLGMLVIAPIYVIVAVRWWIILRARGIEVSKWRAFRLCMIGCFFNYCMPGSTGGDFVKAYYAAKRSDRRADTVMTVIIDRIVGLLGLVLLAGLAGLCMLHDPVAQRITAYIWLVSAGITLASAFYFSRRLRQLVGLDWLLAKLPAESLPAKLDRATVAYSNHKMMVFLTIIMSLPVHILLAISTGMAGYALGMKTDYMLLATVVPVLFLVMAVPISYQGFGIMEWVAISLLLPSGTASANQIVVMLLMARVYQIVYSLTGSLFLLRGDIHMHPAPEEEKSVAPPMARAV